MSIFKKKSEETACGGCTGCGMGPLKRMGTEGRGVDYVVALAGNPNTGKSTIFNALTGLRQHVGNWPGKTVVRAEGGFRFNSHKYRIVDLPGTYSLLSTSADEEVARDFLLFGRPDVTIVVVDATRLERNLNLALQVLEITGRTVIALNLMDEAGRAGLTVDDRALARDLGVPVVPMSARRGQGIDALLKSLDEVARGAFVPRPRRIRYRDEALRDAVETLAEQVEAVFPKLPNAHWVALRLLEGDESVVHAVRERSLGSLAQIKAPVNSPVPLEVV